MFLASYRPLWYLASPLRCVGGSLILVPGKREFVESLWVGWGNFLVTGSCFRGRFPGGTGHHHQPRPGTSRRICAWVPGREHGKEESFVPMFGHVLCMLVVTDT